MDWNKLTIAARESLAADMCYSTETQDTYRWISGNRISRQGKKQKHLQVITHTLGVCVTNARYTLGVCVTNGRSACQQVNVLTVTSNMFYARTAS